MSFKVIISTPTWFLSGVNTVSANLIRGLQGHGISAHILWTKPNYTNRMDFPFPADLPSVRLPVDDKRKVDWEEHWERLIAYLEGQAPCIYIPNYDFDHSCVCPKLSNRVGIVGIVHSDDPDHYEHVSRLGRFWNRIVSVSALIAEKIEGIDPSFADKLITIPNGVAVPDAFIKRRGGNDDPLKIVYAGRLVQHQKRIRDLIQIVQVLLKRDIDFNLTLIGTGPEEAYLREEWSDLTEANIIRFTGVIPNEKTMSVFAKNDIFLLTSDFEGSPVALVEAMGRGCVPVVSDVRSGIPEMIEHGVNGYRVSIGDIQQFAEVLISLKTDIALRRKMSLQAYETVSQGRYNLEDMTQSYIAVFHQVIEEITKGNYERPFGNISPPYSLFRFILKNPPDRNQEQGLWQELHALSVKLEQMPGYLFLIKIVSILVRVLNKTLRWFKKN